MLPVTSRQQYPLLTSLALSLLFWLGLGSHPHHASAQIFTYVVTKTADTADGACDEDCSLREAITVANTISGPKNVFLGAGIHVLSREGRDEDEGLTGDLDVINSVTIWGAGVEETVIDGASLDRVLHVLGAPEVFVTIRELTIRGGLVYGGYPAGGGGGLYNQGTTVVLEHVRVEDNRVESDDIFAGGGGVSTYQGATLIENCTVAGNEYRGTLLGGGGGVFNMFGQTKVSSSTVSGNTSYGRGGGLMNLGSSSTLWLTNSTVSGNAVIGDGGPTKVTGGGVFTDDGTTYIDFCTVTDNYASDHGGGVSHDGLRVELRGTIVAGNHVPPGAPGPDCLQGPFGAPMIVTNGYNLIGDNRSCATFAPGLPTDLVGDTESPLDPRLVSLADNGGPTATHALLADSPALDVVSDAEVCPELDQRGLSRPYGAGCDVGSFERTPTEVSGTVTDARGAAILGVSIVATGAAGRFETVTSSGGAFAFANLPAGSYTLSASRAGFTFSPNVPATVPPSVSGLSFRGYDRPPIVLVAGFSSAYGTAFPPVSTDLRAAGYYVREADLVNLSDGHVPTMEANVVPLLSTIDAVKAETGQPQVILVAHSMGGLVSRAYVEGPAYPARRDVAQLFTFGTPHLGISPLWSDIVPFLVTGLTAGTINNLTDCVVMPGFCQMSRSSMLAFNSIYHRAPGIDYHAVGGDAPMWRKKTFYIPFPIRISVPENTWHNAVGWVVSALIPGPDDAFIETGSSLGLSGIYVDRYRTQEVHSSALGHRSYFAYDGGRSQQSYASCLAALLVNKTSRTCGSRQATPPAAAGTPALLADAEPPEEASEDNDHTPVVWTDLGSGEIVAREVAAPTANLTFGALWSEGPHNFTLVDPNGTHIAPSSGDDGLVQYSEDANGAMYVLTNAVPGLWQMVVQGRAGSADATLATFATFSSPVHLQSRLPDPDRPWYPSGSLLPVRAFLSEPALTAEVEAHIILSDGSESRFSLALQPDDSYAGSYAIGATPGLAHLLVSARGSLADGTVFELETRDDFLIMVDDPIVTGEFAEALVPRPGSSLYDGLRISVGVSAEAPRHVVMAGDLATPEGVVVAHAVSIEEVSAGASQLHLTFSADELFRSQVAGPLMLTHLRIVDNDSIPPVPSTDVDDVHLTAPLDYRLFAPEGDNPVLDAGGPYSVSEGGSVMLSAHAVDPEGDPLAFRWDLDDDGVFETWGASAAFDASQLDGPALRSVAVSASDGSHRVSEGTTVDVVNVAPGVDSIAPSVVELGATFELREVPFSDPGLADVHAASVDWGDGSPLEPAVVVEQRPGGKLSASHVYMLSGTYEGEVCVTDDDDGVGCEAFETKVAAGPRCKAARANPSRLWPANHAFVPVTITGVIDPEGGEVAIVIERVFQDERVRSSGSGQTAPDARGVGTSTAWLRAEREGGGNGRVYHVRFSARDSDGLECRGEVAVSVPQSVAKPAVDDGARFDSTVCKF